MRQSSNKGYSTQTQSNDEDSQNPANPEGECDVVTYRAVNTDMGIPEDANISITTCTNVQILCGGDRPLDVIALLDNGSTTSYISENLVQYLNLRSVGQWSGNMTTLHGSKFEIDQIYKLIVIDSQNKTHAVFLHGTKNIGSKKSLPQLFFNKLCTAFKMAKK